jgi:hypothetical protein
VSTRPATTSAIAIAVLRRKVVTGSAAYRVPMNSATAAAAVSSLPSSVGSSSSTLRCSRAR